MALDEMNTPYRPLQMPSIGGRGLQRQRRRSMILWALAALCALIIFVASRPRIAPRPLANLQKNGVHGVYNLHAKNGELLLYNFRAVETNKVFRCSRFPRNHRSQLNGKMGLSAAAYFHGQAFDFLRSHNIRTVFLTESEVESYALKGYLESQAQRTGHRIRLINYPVPPKQAYARGTGERESALRRAAQFIQFM